MIVDIIQDFRNELERRKGQRQEVDKSLKCCNESVKLLKTKERNLEDAQATIQTVAQLTQQELEFQISGIVSLALDAIFPDPYKLNLEFEIKRGTTEAVLTFSKHRKEERIHPLTASGGGVVDVAALALRVALWSLKRPRSRNVLVLDEPLRFLSRDMQTKASLMLKEISEKLGIQFIIVTHEPNLLEAADRIFSVSQTKGVTRIEPTKIKAEIS